MNAKDLKASVAQDTPPPRASAIELLHDDAPEGTAPDLVSDDQLAIVTGGAFPFIQC